LPLLASISGEFASSRLSAVIGATGSGKSTLMDVLAGRKTHGIEGGVICVNGNVVSKRRRAAVIAYCEQEDEHPPT